MGKKVIAPKNIKQSKQQAIYQALRSSIMKNELAIGSLLSERDLSIQFNTSRTPVREALKQLEYDGLLEIIPHRGVFVADIKFEDIFEIYEARAGLDAIAVRLFIQRKTDEKIAKLEECMEKYRQTSSEYNIPLATKYNMQFHLEIAEGTMNKRIIQYERQLINQCQRAILLNIISISQQDISVQEHENILLHIKEGNVEEAEKAARDHVLTGITFLSGVYNQYYSHY
jgi:DNA-binding GntR family transcriptional regulator